MIGNTSRTGMVNSPEMRAKISLGLKGNKCGIGNKSRLGQKRSVAEIEKSRITRRHMHYHHSEETKKKIAMAHLGIQTCLGKKNALGYRHTEVRKAHWSRIRRGRRQHPETKAKIAEAHIGRPVSEETREKLRQWNLAHRDVLVRIGKKAWENPSKVASMMANMLKARQQRPNGLETDFLEFLNRHFPDEWKYVGNGDLIIGRKCPDFVNINGKKQLIELFGDYWHRGQNPSDRVELFKQYGFDTLILWEADIKTLPEEALVWVITFFKRDSTQRDRVTPRVSSIRR